MLKYRELVNKILRIYEDKFEYLYGLDVISYTLYCLSSNDLYFYREKFPKNHDHKFLSFHLTISRSLSSTIFRIMPKNLEYSNIFRRMVSDKENKLRNIGIFCSNIYSKSAEIELLFKYYSKVYDSKQNNQYLKFIDDFVNNNEKILIYIFKKISSEITEIKIDYIKNMLERDNMILCKIQKSEEILKDIDNYCLKILSAFSQTQEDTTQWSNKIYIATRKMMSVFIVLKKSKISRWKVEVFKREFYLWIDEVNNILNWYEISDNWKLIKNLLVEENDTIEWKSSFFIPTQEKYISIDAEKNKRKEILDSVVKAIIGMTNQNGGSILVGLIENTNSIVREDVKSNLLEKNGKVFFDINYEIEKEFKGNEKTDYLKRTIQDQLVSKTGQEMIKVANIFDIKPIVLKQDYKQVCVYLIYVNKSTPKIFTKKITDGVVWISLTQRTNGRTIPVDPLVLFENKI